MTTDNRTEAALRDLIARIDGLYNDPSLICDEMRWDNLLDSEELRAARLALSPLTQPPEY